MAAQEVPYMDISIEEIPNRCREHFPDGSQCWNMAMKVVRFRGETRVMCIPHLEEWIQKIIERVGNH